MVRKRKMNLLCPRDSDCSDSDQPSPKRSCISPSDRDFINDNENETQPSPLRDALSFDEGSGTSHDYSQDSVHDNFVLPPYAAARARVLARNKKGLLARLTRHSCLTQLFAFAGTDIPFADSPERGPVSEYIDEVAHSGSEESEEGEGEEEGEAGETASHQQQEVHTPERSSPSLLAPSIKFQRKIALTKKKALFDVTAVPFSKTLLDVDQLDDSVLGNFQRILQKTYPSINGWQAPCLASVRDPMSGFAAVSGFCVQIMNNFREHWLVAARTCAGLFVADSLLSEPSEPVIDQLVHVFGDAKTPCLDVEYIPCQRQTGSIHCGDFAAFNAAIFAKCISFNRKELLKAFERTHIDQSKMRCHLLDCVAEDAYAPPPCLDTDPSCTIHQAISYCIDTNSRSCVRVSVHNQPSIV